MKDKINDKARLKHIIDSIQEIENYCNGVNQESFISNSMLKSACLHQLTIIGEAITNISKELKMEHPEIDWKGFSGLRIKVVHVYFGIDFKIVWNIIQSELSQLKENIQAIYNSFLM